MMHLRDLQKLEGVLSPSHLEVNYYPRLSCCIYLSWNNPVFDELCSPLAGNGVCSFFEAEQSEYKDMQGDFLGHILLTNVLNCVVGRFSRVLWVSQTQTSYSTVKSIEAHGGRHEIANVFSCCNIFVSDVLCLFSFSFVFCLEPLLSCYA